MMPSDSYRLYQVERLKTAAEIRRADEHAGRLAATVARLVRAVVSRAAEPAGRRSRMIEMMEGR